MANYEWKTTSTKGLVFRVHSTRKISKGAVGKDRFYQYRMMVDGERVRESFGWESEWLKVDPETRKGRSFEVYCIQQIEGLREARRTGRGAGTLAEKKAAEQARKAAEEAKRKLTERERLTFNDVWENDQLIQKLTGYRDEETGEWIAAVSYLTQTRGDRGEKALGREVSIYSLWIKPVIGQRPLNEIEKFHLERIKSIMTQAGRAPRSLQYSFSIIRQVFNYAISINLFAGSNPIKPKKKSAVKLPKIDNKRTRFLTREEADQLLDALRAVSIETHDHALMSLHTGMRAGEIWNLTWADVEIDQGTLTLRDTKNGTTRTAYMTGDLKAMLKARRPASPEPSALVFPGRGGVKIVQVSETYNRAVAKLGLNEGITDRRQKVTFHTLRHTFASWHAQNGTDLYVLKNLLGHSTIQLTERYAHLNPNTLQAAVNGMERALAKENSTAIDDAAQKLFEITQPG